MEAIDLMEAIETIVEEWQNCAISEDEALDQIANLMKERK
jgi:hypothetical protein